MTSKHDKKSGKLFETAFLTTQALNACQRNKCASAKDAARKVEDKFREDVMKLIPGNTVKDNANIDVIMKGKNKIAVAAKVAKYVKESATDKSESDVDNMALGKSDGAKKAEKA